ncbi:MAG: hypothetical protein C0613_12160 [Desulfobulbaceae bacterium]|nr:MAG: hypothetical protein C0613_12160 [Desulfobulbaceae bacterium]
MAKDIMTRDKKRSPVCALLGNRCGFSLVELIMVTIVLGVLAAIAVPTMYKWLPGIRLKSAARDVYSSLQKARMDALKENQDVQVRFVDSADNDYLYLDMDGSGSLNSGEYSLNITGYKSGVGFGYGSAINNWNGDAITSAVPATPVITFTNRGTAVNRTIYLDNEEQDGCYAITVNTSGSIKLRRYTGSTWVD